MPNFDNILVCLPSERKYLVFVLSSKKDYWDAELGILSNLFLFFLLKVEVKYEALTMLQDQYRVETWLETAMEQNNEVLILCVCVCVCVCVFYSPVASSTAFWQINMVNELCSCVSTLPHLFPRHCCKQEKTQWGKMDAQSPCALWLGLE